MAEAGILRSAHRAVFHVLLQVLAGSAKRHRQEAEEIVAEALG
jgi:hypothetical protein